MAIWHADAKKVSNIDAGPFQGNGGRKLVWHSTEGSSLPNYGGSSPHFTINPGTGDLWQHIPIDRAARALMAGGPNMWTASYQVEIIGFAKDSANWPPSWYKRLGKLARWIEKNGGVPRRAGVTFTDSQHVNRMTADEFRSYAGHCGHQHVPGNTHWDPGLLNIGMILGGDADPPLSDPLARGDHGANVMLLKQRLEKAHGYRLDTTDDGFGKMTEAAVVHFQWRKGLAPDGIVGPVTWSAVWD